MVEMPRSLVLVVAFEIVLDIGALIWSVSTRNTAALPGAIGRLLVVGGLGLLAVLKRRSWARWAFACFQYFTAIAAFVVTFVVPGRGVRFQSIGLVMGVAYLVLGVAASIARLDTSTPGDTHMTSKLQNNEMQQTSRG
jgi:peptidoglycan/LPS O-acetylase OafA/YrhL